MAVACGIDGAAHYDTGTRGRHILSEGRQGAVAQGDPTGEGAEPGGAEVHTVGCCAIGPRKRTPATARLCVQEAKRPSVLKQSISMRVRPAAGTSTR